MRADPPGPESARRTSVRPMRSLFVYFFAVVFVLAGVLHFVRPAAYARIVPPFLRYRRALVYISGVAEVVGGLALLVPALRPWAGLWLVALLVAVFPANVYMAVAPARAGFGVAPVWLWLRLPLQLVLIAAVWWTTRPGILLGG